MKHVKPDAWGKQEMTEAQTAAWYKSISDKDIAYLKAHNVWYGPESTRPAPEPEPNIEPDPQPAPPSLDGLSLPESIIALCAQNQRVSIPLFRSRKRRHPAVKARQSAAWLIRKHCTTVNGAQLSTTAIGQKMGGRDHATILHALKRVDADLGTGGEKFGPIIEYVERELGLAPVNSGHDC